MQEGGNFLRAEGSFVVAEVLITSEIVVRRGSSR